MGLALMAGMVWVSGCRPIRGETLWRERTPGHGTVWIETDRGSAWTDASYQRARAEIGDWCHGPATMTWEGVVSADDAVAWQETSVGRGDTRIDQGRIVSGGQQVWELRFQCQAVTARAAPAPVDAPQPPIGSAAASTSPPCCKR